MKSKSLHSLCPQINNIYVCNKKKRRHFPVWEGKWVLIEF